MLHVFLLKELFLFSYPAVPASIFCYFLLYDQFKQSNAEIGKACNLSNQDEGRENNADLMKTTAKLMPMYSYHNVGLTYQDVNILLRGAGTFKA